LSVPAALCPVSSGPIRLEQMLTNVLSNAFRYTPPSGQVEVAVAALPNTARVTVLDSGPGIPAESLPFILNVSIGQINARAQRAVGWAAVAATLPGAWR
jgi:signal transduction histidine kinase